MSLVDELTGKIESAYVMLKRRYSVAPARMEIYNKIIDSEYIV